MNYSNIMVCLTFDWILEIFMVGLTVRIFTMGSLASCVSLDGLDDGGKVQ